MLVRFSQSAFLIQIVSNSFHWVQGCVWVRDKIWFIYFIITIKIKGIINSTSIRAVSSMHLFPAILAKCNGSDTRVPLGFMLSKLITIHTAPFISRTIACSKWKKIKKVPVQLINMLYWFIKGYFDELL